jgi:hypothetical protein
MTLQILFQKLGSSYDDILYRLVSEERIIKFLKMFFAKKHVSYDLYAPFFID